jgi:glycine oxidase
MGGRAPYGRPLRAVGAGPRMRPGRTLLNVSRTPKRAPTIRTHALPDVLVVGGGIIGTLCALDLARRGLAVTVVERGRPGREASWAGAGILSPIYPWRYPDALGHLVQRSLLLYPDLVRDLMAVSGVDPQLRRTGLVIPVFRAAEWADLAPALPWSTRFGWRAERLSAAETMAVEPCLSERVAGAVYWPNVAQVRNPRLARAAEVAARAAGVTFRTGEDVTGFTREGDRVVAVHIGAGRLAAGRFLLAAGSWSGELGAQAGLDLPVAPVKGQILLLRDAPGRLKRIIKHDRAYLVPRADGRVLVGATMEMAGFDRRTTLEALHFLSGALLDLAPPLAGAEVERHWMGFRPGTPDGLPYIGRAPGVDNLYVATGHYRNGVILAPATAEAVGCLIAGEAPPVSLEAFAVDRARRADADLGFPRAAGARPAQ